MLKHALALFVLVCLLPLMAQADAPQILLLGEVHDNPQGHALRFKELESRVAAGWRPAIAMEQFDLPQQAALSRAQRQCGADARCIVEAAKGSARWDWPQYLPVIQLAQQYRLPLLAANLSREDAGKIVRQGWQAGLAEKLVSQYGLAELAPVLEEGQIAAVRAGHCGKLPEDLLPGMARAQIARDVMMTEVIRAAGANVVLLAGNGHVRSDIGVPYWLNRSGIRSENIGYVEDQPGTQSYQYTRIIPKRPRPDPCTGL